MTGQQAIDANDPQARAEAERDEAYEFSRANSPLNFSPLRRLWTFDRDVRSWPQFFAWVAGVALAYWWIGRQYWDFTDPVTGQTDPWIIVVFFVICTSVVWLFWPLPKRTGKRSDG